MIIIQKGSSHAIIVVHEIYGINQHIKDLCETLSEINFDVFCPNLIEQEKPFSYANEQAAYLNFMENVGFDCAMSKVKNLLLSIKDSYQKVFIIGYSVGATVAWLCSSEKRVDGVIGYYGSRIREYIDISSKCPTLLFFPDKETSFNVDELIVALAEKNIDIHKFKGPHGFSDPYSQKYNGEAAQKACKEMVKFLLTHSSRP